MREAVGGVRKVGLPDLAQTKPFSRKWVWIVGVAGRGLERERLAGWVRLRVPDFAGHGPAPL